MQVGDFALCFCFSLQIGWLTNELSGISYFALTMKLPSASKLMVREAATSSYLWWQGRGGRPTWPNTTMACGNIAWLMVIG